MDRQCPFYSRTSSKYPRMQCMHYHSGLQWLDFSNRDELHKWKDTYCTGDFRTCKYYPENVGRDTTYENAWIVLVSYRGKEYWKRAVSDRVLHQAINDILVDVVNLDPDNLPTQMNIKINVLHSSDPGFHEALSDLQFSGNRLEDTREGW